MNRIGLNTRIKLCDKYNDILEEKKGPEEINCKYFSKKVLMIDAESDEKGTYLKIIIKKGQDQIYISG